MPTIAKSVVRDVTPGKYAFIVDGEPFPWWLPEGGPSARKLADDLYLVHVEIVCTTTKGDDRPEQFYHEGLGTGSGWPQPVILGVEFPWWISEDGFTYRSSHRELPIVELEFFAESVAGMPVTEAEPPEDGKIRAAGGYVIRRVDPVRVTFA